MLIEKIIQYKCTYCNKIFATEEEAVEYIKDFYLTIHR